MSDSKVLKEAMDQFFDSCGKADDPHAKIVLQWVLEELCKGATRTENRYWVKCNENVSILGKT